MAPAALKQDMSRRVSGVGEEASVTEILSSIRRIIESNNAAFDQQRADEIQAAARANDNRGQTTMASGDTSIHTPQQTAASMQEATPQPTQSESAVSLSSQDATIPVDVAMQKLAARIGLSNSATATPATNPAPTANVAHGVRQNPDGSAHVTSFTAQRSNAAGQYEQAPHMPKMTNMPEAPKNFAQTGRETPQVAAATRAGNHAASSAAQSFKSTPLNNTATASNASAPLVSAQSAQRIDNALEQLQSHLDDKVLEQRVMELLPHYLGQWLDRHLAPMVEKIVREEITRLTTKR